MESDQFCRVDRPECPVLRVDGEIDLVVRDDLRAALRRLVLDAHSPAHLDLSGVAFFDSTGVHALLEARTLAAERGVELVVTPSRPVTATLEVLGLGGAFRWVDPPPAAPPE